jgi:predicted acyltransferase
MSPRLRSLDALRGFDMLWIVGGAGVLQALAEDPAWHWLQWLAGQTHHVEWNGFKGWDGIFPLFLFLAGVSLPYSFAKRRAAGATTPELVRHSLRRGLTLVFLGVVYNGLLAFDFASLRYASVLGRIGLAWMLAALIVLRTPSTRALVLWTVGILLGYWALMTLVPVPGQGVASLEPGRTLADWLDRQLLPGRLHRGVRDPEGLLSTVPAIATALAGVLTGRWLRKEGSGERKALGLAAAGVAGMGLGWLWGQVLPLNKNLWSSSFTVFTAGGSLLLLSVFYWTIDVRGWVRWSFPLKVIGVNAITVYLAAAFVDFDRLGELLLAGATPHRLHPALFAAGGLLLEWLVLLAMYRRRLFLRV